MRYAGLLLVGWLAMVACAPEASGPELARRVDAVEPPNDRCSSPQLVTVGTPVVGSTAGANATPCFGFPSVYYRVDAPAAGAYAIEVWADGGVQPFVNTVRGEQAAASFADACPPATKCWWTVSTGQRVVAQGTAGQPFYFMVSGWSVLDFTVRVDAVASVPGDRCSAPQPLDDGQLVTLRLADAVDDYCGSVPDQVFRFTAPDAGTYAVVGRGVAVSVERTCGHAPDGGCGARALARYVDLDAGETLYVLAEEGSADASVQVLRATRPPNDRCESALALTVGTPTPQVSSYLSDSANNCATIGDVFYRFQPPMPGVYRVESVGADGGPVPGVSFSPWDEPWCALDGGVLCVWGAPSVLFRADAGALFFAATDTSHEPFSAVVRPVQPPAYDTCAGATVVQLGVPASFDFTDTFADYAPVCSGAAGADVVAVFTPPHTGQYAVSSSVVAALSVGTCVGRSCTRVDSPDQLFTLVGGVPVFLVLQSSFGSPSATLLVREAPAPTNDTCASPLDLHVGVPQVGTTLGAHGELCGGSDVVYDFLADHDGTFAVTTSRLDGGAWPGEDGGVVAAWPAVLVGPGCASCSAFPLQARRLFHGEPGVPQFLAVGSNSAADFLVRVDPTADLPGDRCVDPLPLMLGVPLLVDPTGALDDYPSNALPCGWQGTPDLVLRFTAPRDGRYALGCNATYCSGVTLLGSTCGGSACSGDDARTPQQLSAGETRYYLVDRSEPLTVDVHEYQPPANDHCGPTTAAPLTVGQPVTGTLRDAVRDTCALPDVFYRFTAPTSGAYRVQAGSDAGSVFVGSLGPTCAGACETRWLGTTFRGSAGATTYLTVTSADAVDFSLRVDAVTWPGESCQAPLLATTVTDLDFSGAPDTYTDGGCGQAGLPDEVLAFTAPADGYYQINGGNFGVRVQVGACGSACTTLDDHGGVWLAGGVPTYFVVEASTPTGLQGALWVMQADGVRPDAGAGDGGAGDGGAGVDGGSGAGGGGGGSVGGGAGGGGGTPGKPSGCGCTTGAGMAPLWVAALGGLGRLRRRRQG